MNEKDVASIVEQVINELNVKSASNGVIKINGKQTNATPNPRQIPKIYPLILLF